MNEKQVVSTYDGVEGMSKWARWERDEVVGIVKPGQVCCKVHGRTEADDYYLDLNGKSDKAKWYDVETWRAKGYDPYVTKVIGHGIPALRVLYPEDVEDEARTALAQPESKETA